MDRLSKIRKARIAIATQAAQEYKKRMQDVLPSHLKAFERIIGARDESSEIPPNDLAKKHGIPVGRIFEIQSVTEPKGFGTGFLIAPNILITNNHIFGSPEEAYDCAVNFSYEKNAITKEISKGSEFKIQPETFFYTCPELDFSLIYVCGESIDGQHSLELQETLELKPVTEKVALHGAINIIQYPNGGIKKYTTEENTVTAIDEAKGIFYYSTDTMRGSSGSPCFNRLWEVAALHYTSVPRTNSDGNWLTRTGEIWNETMSDDQVDWISNAGTSISKIIEHLKSAQVPEARKIYLRSILSATPDPSISQENKNFHHPKTLPKMTNITMNFNGPTRIYINQGELVTDAQETPLHPVQNISALLEKKERFDENYNSRKGYLENFIPDFSVPFPKVKQELQSQLYNSFETEVPYKAHYHHFTLIMNKKRRMLMWSAANVDYNPALRDSRSRAELGNGAWRLDKRIPEIYQIQAKEFYDPATLVDKGHIVRRDDNCWSELKDGKTDSIGIEYANADTFHWTNCTPQHEAFNRDVAPYAGVGLWGVLENAIKKQLEFIVNDPENANKDYSQRACILSGPIFKDDDPEYMDIQYPLEFWKIFAIHSKSEGNLVYGFILSQADKVQKTGVEKEGLPRFERKVRAMQVTLETITERSGVIFDQTLHDADVTAKGRVSIIE
ncbi:DNA/RNA non-specific endonuclease [Pedobacter psychrodurus]|uniref:DNA/RNA non-specific endonuclease n=1 Tax=Pedobacter psychrodurus TaxID=2530456 RepID=UPI00292FBEDE|nr:DNA/RNA non-specific endonuclease [Pedobacter psychrodurus]